MHVILDLQATLAHHIALAEGQQFPLLRLAAPTGELISAGEQARDFRRVSTAPTPPRLTGRCSSILGRAW